ncbi:hypothetical protein [Phenylobacterium sp.]|nr:hypothetical protein [Phenylobacterium sp.]
MMFVPVSRGMRRDPRFADLADRIGLTGYWRAAGVAPDVDRVA